MFLIFFPLKPYVLKYFVLILVLFLLQSVLLLNALILL